MKEKAFTDIICKRFCAFYKDGQEDLQCGTYIFLRERFSSEALEREITGMYGIPSLSEDGSINNLICDKCEFKVDGCDFREGLDSPPCGGYMIVEYLLKNGLVPGEGNEGAV